MKTKNDALEKAAEEYALASGEAFVNTMRSFWDGAKWQATQDKEIIETLVKALEFYAWIQPRQHPEGYYEPHYSPGMGGEDKFGTKAREALETYNQRKGE